MTLQLLWEEHRAVHPDGYGYSRLAILPRLGSSPVADHGRCTSPASACSWTTPARPSMCSTGDQRGSARPTVRRRARRLTVWARITARTVDVFHRGKRVAAHVRSSSNRRHTINPEHMPSSHRRYADWTPERIRRKAGEIGRNTAALIAIILRERRHPEQGFRACTDIVRLADSYGREWSAAWKIHPAYRLT